MRLLNVRGALVTKNVSKYVMKWDAPSKSKIQFQTKQFLKKFWIGCICYEEFPVYGTLLKVDILNASLKIAVEVNGPQHSEYHWFHNGRPTEFLNSNHRDMDKMDWLEKNNFKLAEINYDEIPLLSKDFFREKFDIIL
jgi:hypothetical protein